MYAVIKTGGKQYRVAKDEVIAVEKLSGEAGANLDLDQVLMIGDDKGTTIGSPLVEGASVSAEVVEQTRDGKIIVFKKKRRKNYRRTKGHRQDLTLLRITDINAPGAKKPAARKTAKKADKAPAEATEETKAEDVAETAASEAPKAKAKAKPTTASKSGSAAKPKSAATRSRAKKTDSDEK